MENILTDHKPLPLFTKILYGSGDLSIASWGPLRQIFYAIFLILPALGWFGYQTPPEGAFVYQQSDITVLVIRILTGPYGAILLLSSIIIAWFYPLTREKHTRIRKLLLRRENRSVHFIQFNHHSQEILCPYFRN